MVFFQYFVFSPTVKIKKIFCLRKTKAHRSLQEAKQQDDLDEFLGTWRKEMEEKKTLYELSEDGKKLKNCMEGSEEVVEFKERWQLNEIIDTDQAGAIITMHEYVV